jgi:hypothetical protein
MHMGGGYGIASHYNTSPFGSLFGPGSAGDTLGGVLGASPAAMLQLGSMASLAGMFVGNNRFGSVVRGVGNTLGFGGLGMASSVPVTMIAQALAEQVKTGVEQQHFAQQAMGQVFGERNMGGRLGFGVSRQGASSFANMFRDLSSSTEMLTNDQELKSLFTKFNDMELLKLSKNATDAGARFKKLAETVRDMSRDLGTTLEGVMPMFQREMMMGFTDPTEIRRRAMVNRAMRGVGVGTSDETNMGLQASQSSANFSVGGDKSIGAEGAQKNLALVNVALQRGVLTEADLMAATGQIGERGAADMAQQMMQATRTAMTQGSYGNLMSAYLGETDESGKFTGRMDKERQRELSTVSFEKLSQIASEKLQRGGVSFTAQMNAGMGANLGSQLEGGDVARVFELLFQSLGDDAEDAMQLTLQTMTGMRGETAKRMLRIVQQQRSLTDEVQRQIQENAVRNRLPAEIEHHYALSSRLSQGYRTYIKDPVFNPIQTAAGDMAAGVGGYMDNVGTQFVHKGLGGGFGALFGKGLGTMGGTTDVQSRIQQLFDETRDVSTMSGRVDTLMDKGAAQLGLSYDRDVQGDVTATAPTLVKRVGRTGRLKLRDDKQLTNTGIEYALRQLPSEAGGATYRERIEYTYQNYRSFYLATRRYVAEQEANTRRTPEQEAALVVARAVLAEAEKDIQARARGIRVTDANVRRGELSKQLYDLVESGTAGLTGTTFGNQGQIENDIFQAAAEGGDIRKLRALNDLFMDAGALEGLTHSTPAQLTARMAQRGISLPESEAENIIEMGRSVVRDNGGFTQGSEKYQKRVGQRIRDVSRGLLREDERTRTESFAARLEPYGLSDAFLGGGKALSERLKDFDPTKIEDAEARGLIEAFKDFTQRGEQAQRDLLGADRTKGMSTDQLLEQGLRLATQISANTETDSPAVRALTAAGDAQKVAEILELVNGSITSQLTDTQRQTLDYAIVLADQVKKLKDSVPSK